MSQPSPHALSDTAGAQHPLRAVDVSDPQAALDAIREALAGTVAVLPHRTQVNDACEQLVAQYPSVDASLALVIRTSGSTGEPKAVALSRAALQASAEATHAALGGPGQWLVALSPEVIAGAQMLVRSAVSGENPVWCLGQFTAERFVSAAKTMTGTRRYTSLVPVQLDRLLDSVEGQDAPAHALSVLTRFDAILVGGQAAPESLIARARSLGMHIVRTYGSTETASGCVYEGVPVGDTELRTVDGELWVASSSLASGYLDDAELTAERFVFVDECRWFRTRDAGEVIDGRLELTGRLDNVIVSGGVNVSLDVLERFVNAQPGWQGALVVGRTDPTWGQRPVVCIVGSAPEFSGLQATVRESFGPAWVPNEVRELTEVPLLPSGKADRLALAKLF